MPKSFARACRTRAPALHDGVDSATVARGRDDPDDVQALVEDLLRQAAAMREQWTRVAEAAGLEPPTEGPPDPDFPSVPEDDLVRMRLVGLDMMLAGASRDDVVAHLRSTFGEEHVEHVVDDIFRQYE